MSLRKTLNDKPVLGVGLLVLLVAAGIGYYVFATGEGALATGRRQPAYFSSDDGKTFFIDDPVEPPPYVREGAEVARAFVYRDKVTGEEFVGYLLKYGPEEKAQLIDMESKGITGMPPPGLVKRPGDTEWINTGDFERREEIKAVMQIRQSPAGNPVVGINPG